MSGVLYFNHRNVYTIHTHTHTNDTRTYKRKHTKCSAVYMYTNSFMCAMCSTQVHEFVQFISIEVKPFSMNQAANQNRIRITTTLTTHMSKTRRKLVSFDRILDAIRFDHLQ